MEAALLDHLVVFFALVFYAFLFVIYFLRARELSEFEFKLRIAFSVQLIPFTSLWILNLLVGNDSGRVLAGLPIIIYLVYDLYRALTRKKPLHHPKRWPPSFIIYLLFLFRGSIGLNWYGYLMSRFYGLMLVIAFFIMLSSYG
jgi:hypothetical protein